MVPERAAVSAGWEVKEEAMISFRQEVGWYMGVVFIFRQQSFMGRCGVFSILPYPQDLAGLWEGVETVGNE